MGERRWLLAEMHCHSTNSDGKSTPEEIVALYEEKGYDVLAITDHDFLTKAVSDKMVIIPACEWTDGFRRHLLVYFLERASGSLNEAVSQGALICLAHPVLWPFWKKIPPQVKGYEAFNGGLVRKFKIFGSMANAITAFWYGRFYKIMVAGSDAHQKQHFAKVKLWIWAKPESEDIKQALLEGRVRIEGY